MPSPATLAQQGLEAFTAARYADAINLYTQALSVSPESPDYYLKRSTAYQRTGQSDLALHDAELAVMLADKRGKRELVGSAQMRRGMVLFLQNRYGDAILCFDKAEERCGDKEKNVLSIWRAKVQQALQKVDLDDISREVTIAEIPQLQVPKQSQYKVTELDGSGPDATKTQLDGGLAKETAVTPAPAPVPGGVTTPANKIRHEWYQTHTDIVFTLYVKGAPKDKTNIEITDRSLAISFPLPTGSDFTFDVDPLWDQVDSKKATSSVLSTKIEIKMPKSNTGKKWADLEGSEAAPAKVEIAVEQKPTEEPAVPSYPTSSKKGPKDWDKVAKELTAKKKKKKDKSAKKDGEEDDDGEDDEAEYGSDYEGGDPANYFFQKLYKSADDDTRRAMMKSYVESNGTALSTNWSEVGKGKVETSPPDGMVAKHWKE